MLKKRVNRLFLLGVSFLILVIWSLLLVGLLENKLIDFKKKKDVWASYRHPQMPIVLPDKKKQVKGIMAKAFLLIDSKTNTILNEKNKKLRIFPASTTKLISALTALNIYPLNEVVEIKERYDNGKVMELEIGEKIKVEDLVKALLVYSANDAAFNLAKHHPRGINGFVSEMNGILRKYKLKDSRFTNFDGLHNQEHYSTIYDLSQIARLAIKNKIVKQTVKIKDIKIVSLTGQEHQLENTNELLRKIPEVKGLKTGWTPEAGGCFIALFNINGHELISVVAQSDDRFGDTEKILNWAKENVSWEEYR
ncbi:hypothetical protein DRH14_00865 [Candidatus Shapirobacteria bacterium]|nr:MAG: hypothetical protein DRH14_00865 [Candidatus Shapirobacteria bacterium]